MDLLLVTLLTLGVVNGYPDGPPLDACGDMFPTGHHADAKTITPPFTLTATVPEDTIDAGKTVTLILKATGDPTYPYFEGMFVQARKADNCDSDEPLGSFNIPAGDTFMKLMNCNSLSNSAVAHKQAVHETNKTFNWIVPAHYVGRIYFRATVVKNEKNFWTNVFSGYLTYSNDTSAAPAKPCAVRMSSVSAVRASLITALLPLTAAFFGIVSRSL